MNRSQNIHANNRNHPSINSCSPNGKYLVLGGKSYLGIWDTQQLQQIQKLTLSPTSIIKALAWSPDSKQLAVLMADSSWRIQIWNLTNALKEYELALPGKEMQFPGTISWSPTAPHLAVIAGNKLLFLDLEDELHLRFQNDSWLPGCLSWSPGGDLLAASRYVTEIAATQLELWDRASQKRIKIFPRGWNSNNIHSLAWSENGHHIYALNQNSQREIHSW